MRYVLAALLGLTLFIAAPASGEVETFQVEWASAETYVDPVPVWGAGAGPVTLQSWLAPGNIPGYRLDALRGVTFFFVCPDSVNCTVDGGFTWPYDGVMVLQRINGSPGAATLQLDVRWYGHNNNGQLIAAGIKEVVAPPPPPPPPPTTLKVFITQPKAAATVSGTAWIVLWVEGTSGTSNTFTLSADGTQIATRTTTARGPVSIPWPTIALPNGAHSLTATVRDATGNTGTTTMTVIVSNVTNTSLTPGTGQLGF